MKPGYLVVLAFSLSFSFGLVLFLSLSLSSSQSDGTPIDHSPPMQAQRLSAIRQLQKKGIIYQVDCESPQRLWILPAFHVLEFGDKSVIANAVYAYCFPTVAARNVLLLMDKKTGKTAGYFSPMGLKIK
jgi:hypothetical protein